MVDNRKGVGYMIEAFLAVLTLFVFAVGSLQAPPSHDWNRFQSEVAAKDLGYVLQETGQMERFLERGETGSIQTSVAALTDDRLQVSGNIKGLPVGEKQVGFHVLDSQVHGVSIPTVSSVDDSCEDDNDLEEIDSEYDIRRASRHSTYLYVADTDPDITGGFNGEEDYDTVWVDNGTRCQFSAAEGPYYRDSFFWWGDSGDSDTTDTHYDFKNVTDGSEKLVVYEADQPARFRKTMISGVNGISTGTQVDTFNFSTGDLSVYDAVVFRREAGLDRINDGRQQRMLDYLEDGSALFLVDLEESDLQTGFMSRTGLEWKELNWTAGPSGANFSETGDSRRTENLFLGQSGSRQQVSLLPGANISSGDRPLIYSWNGRYKTDGWNATNTSMLEENSPPEGTTGSSCDNYYRGNFSFPSDDYFGYSSELGDCTTSPEIWAVSLNLDKDTSISDGEKTFVDGDRIVVDGREYRVRVYSGSEMDFVYTGTENVELVNHLTSFEDREIKRFARADYEQSYSADDRKLLASVIYWLAAGKNSFGPGGSTVSTVVAGGVKNRVYIPYRLDLRWSN